MSLRRATPGILLLIGLSTSACGGESKTPPQSAAGVANQRLQGNWRLLSFTPSLALEEPLRGFVEAQLKTLTISFANGEFTATGPGVNTSGRIEISQAEGDSLTGRVYDRAGAGYGVAGQFIGQQFRFVSQDPPWGGNGVLERAP
jgi:hypothetical protein